MVGVPSSAASYASGQEQAPAALRAAGLIAALQATAGSVHDDGDLPVQTWRPDRERPLAQNVEQVVRNIRDVADRVEPAAARVGRGVQLRHIGWTSTFLRSLRQPVCGHPEPLLVHGRTRRPKNVWCLQPIVI
jgi:arginase